MTRTRIAVLGADGFVGRAVVDALARSDASLPIAMGRRPSARAPSGIERLTVDATDAAALGAALKTMDGVVNCVLGDAATIQRNAAALFGIALGRPDLRVVHTSSMAVYGSAVGDVDEDTPLQDDIGPYSVAKVYAEREAARCANVAILRPGIVYGPGGPQWSTRIAEWLVARRIGDLGAAGDGYCNLIHVDDVAKAAVLAIETPAAAGQAFNLSMADPPTWNEYFQRYAKQLGAVPTRRISQRRLKMETKVLAPPLKIAEILGRKAGLSKLKLPQAIPPSLLMLWRQEIRLSMRKTEQQLGLRCIPLDEGLRATAQAWLRSR